MRKAVLSYRAKPDRKIPIGFLVFDGKHYSFEYDESALKNSETSSLIDILPFSTQTVTYSNKLFPFFSRRLPDKKRRDYHTILDRFGISDNAELELLFVNNGRLPTDNFEITEIK